MTQFFSSLFFLCSLRERSSLYFILHYLRRLIARRMGKEDRRNCNNPTPHIQVLIGNKINLWNNFAWLIITTILHQRHVLSNSLILSDQSTIPFFQNLTLPNSGMWKAK